MTQPPTTERELPMLAGIGAFVTWCEDLLAILSGPILTAGLAIALVALLTDGQLLARVPALLWVWAISQAIGLDAQFIGAAAKLARAIRRRHVWAVLGYALLCAALGYVGYLASNVFATSEANGVTTAQALARLGMDSTSWIVQRSVLAVVLVFLSGLLRYVAPARNVALSADEERQQLEADLMLEPLRQQKRAMQARGLRSVAAAAMGRETPSPAEATPAPSGEATVPSEPSEPSETPPEPPLPTGPGTPKKRGVRTQADPDAPNVLQMPAAPTRRRRRKKAAQAGVRTNVSVEAKARAAWQPNMAVAALRNAAGISHGSAMKYARLLAAEDAARASQQSDQAAQ